MPDIPRPQGRIALISDGAAAWYSGMLPGLLAGRYWPDQCRVQLSALCASAGIELIQGEIAGIDPGSNSLKLADGRVYSAKWLSLNVGSTLEPLQVTACDLDMIPRSSLVSSALGKLGSKNTSSLSNFRWWGRRG